MGLPTASDLYAYDPSTEAAILFNVLYAIFIGPYFVLSCGRCLGLGPSNTASGQRSAKHRDNVSLYATSSSLIVVSPVFVCATLYLLVVRMIQMYLPVGHQTFFNVSPRLLGKLFITSNIMSFMTQGAGSAIAASGNWQGSSRTAGIDVLLVGLALQLATFTFFLVVTWWFVCTLRLAEGESFNPSLKKMLTGVWIAAIFVEIRSIYRVVEFALGTEGYPFQHEWSLSVLEATPMLFAVGILAAVYHPVNLIQKSSSAVLDDGTDVESAKGWFLE